MSHIRLDSCALDKWRNVWKGATQPFISLPGVHLRRQIPPILLRRQMLAPGLYRENQVGINLAWQALSDFLLIDKANSTRKMSSQVWSCDVAFDQTRFAAQLASIKKKNRLGSFYKCTFQLQRCPQNRGIKPKMPQPNYNNCDDAGASDVFIKLFNKRRITFAFLRGVFIGNSRRTRLIVNAWSTWNALPKFKNKIIYVSQIYRTFAFRYYYRLASVVGASLALNARPKQWRNWEITRNKTTMLYAITTTFIL
jgi:hypothetical protein